MHRGTDFDDLRWARDMQRATTSDTEGIFGERGAAAFAVTEY
jgi:hypothetical protein